MLQRESLVDVLHLKQLLEPFLRWIWHDTQTINPDAVHRNLKCHLYGFVGGSAQAFKD